jgi:ArsR family transcriptional regulator
MKPHEQFKGLGDPTRLRIVALLLEKELCVCDLLEVLRLPQSTVSRHLAKLKSSGLVLDRREGKWVHYRLEETPLVKDLRKVLKDNLTRVEPYASDIGRLHNLISAGRCVACQ